MNTALVRGTTLLAWWCLGSIVMAQTPGSFGAPSRLPPTDPSVPYQTAYTYPSTDQPGYPSLYSSVPARAMAAWQQPPANLGHQDVAVPNNQVPPALTAGGCADAWCDSGCCSAPVCPCWYATAAGLLFTRNQPRFSQLSFDDTNPVGQVLSTDTGLGPWAGGFEVQLGWYLSPSSALELTYWGLFADETGGTAYSANIPGNMNSAIDFSPLNIGASNVNDLYDAAQAHRVLRDYSVHNVELNLLNGRMQQVCNDGLQISYLAGLRYLRFAESFQYASADTQPVFGADLANEAYYDIDVSNDLWGFQLGGRGDWNVSDRLAFYTGTKFGIFANQMRQHSLIYNVNGIATVGPGNPLAGSAFDIATNKYYTSFVGELDLGMSYDISCRWSAFLGYRAVAISGIALATDQIPGNMADLVGVADVDASANLILHGAYGGVVFGW